MRTRALLHPLHDRDTRNWWLVFLSTLSLDQALPFWSPLDLRFTAPLRVRQAMREYVLAEQLMPGDGTSRTYGRKVLTLTRTFFREVKACEPNRRRAEEALTALWSAFERAWVSEPNWHWMWRILCSQLETVALKPWGLPRDKAQRLVELAGAFAEQGRLLESRVTQAQARPRTAWDHQQITYQQQGCADFEPLEILAEGLDRIAFDRVWAEVVSLLSLPEMESLVRWGRFRAAEIEANKDAESRQTDQFLGDQALRVRDAIVPASYRAWN